MHYCTAAWQATQDYALKASFLRIITIPATCAELWRLLRQFYGTGPQATGSKGIDIEVSPDRAGTQHNPLSQSICAAYTRGRLACSRDLDPTSAQLLFRKFDAVEAAAIRDGGRPNHLERGTGRETDWY